jgi:hypothetical protein
MLGRIEAFSIGKLKLTILIASIEALLEASEIKEKKFISDCYDKLVPLEEVSAHYAGTGNEVPISEIVVDLK